MDTSGLAPPIHPLQKRRLGFFFGVLLLVVLVVAATGSALWRLRTEALNRQTAMATLTARAMEDQLTQSFTTIAHTLTLVGEDPLAANRLDFYLQQAPYLRSISILGAQQHIVASSNPDNIGLVVDRHSFLPQSTSPVAVLRTGSLQIGRDYSDIQIGEVQSLNRRNISFIPVSIDVIHTDGTSQTILATVNTDYFLNFYLSHLKDDQGQVVLMRYDGEVLVKSQDQITAPAFTPYLMAQLNLNDAGNYADTLPDGKTLLTAYRASRDYPLLLIVRAEQQVVLNSWQHEASLVSLVVGSVLLLLSSFGGIYLVRVERMERTRLRYEQQLSIAAAAFESQQGIVVTDADNQILRVNRAFCEITGYSEEEAIGNTPHMLSSGKHSQSFYSSMWNQLVHKGCWNGEIWNRRKNGDIYPEWLSITAIKDNDQRISHYVGTLTDITQRKQAEDEIRSLAFYDPLTKLPNRRLLLDRLLQAITAANRFETLGALLFIDLDNFKTLNDTLGHDIGDLLLQEVGVRLSTCIQEGDTVARLGGDEFVLILPNLSKDADEAIALAHTLGEQARQRLNHPYQLSGHDYLSTPSIGIAMFGQAEDDCDELMKRADLALYGAKAAGRNTVIFFDQAMQTSLSERTHLEAAMRQAVSLDQLVLFFQPQMLASGTIYGAEVLMRWQHPSLGLLSPDKFIPLAEETELIIPMGNWVLEHACKLLHLFSTQPDLQHLTLSVNVSVKQLHQSDFAEQVQHILNATSAPPHRLTLEITESGLINNIETSIEKMEALNKLGVNFSLDDFGTGYSSLSYLKKLPLTQIKIDQSFVRGIHTDANDAAIVRSIIALADALHLQVTAEGVETPDQLNYLKQLGCNSFQGHLLGRPQALTDFMTKLSSLA